MSTTATFLQAIHQGSHKVYGYRLQPLTLHKLTLLDQFCPGVVGGGDMVAEDLKLAAALLSGGKLGGIKPYLLFHNYEKQLAKFNNYISDYLSLPETYENGDASNNPYPFALMFACKLIKQTGYEWDYVFYQMPISLIFWMVSCGDYIETGETNLISDKEQQAIALLNNE